MTSLRPPTPVSLLDITSSRQPWRSAYLLYIRNSSAANSAASSPPVPARISSMTFFSSFGSFGMSRIFSSREQRVAPRVERLQLLAARARACRRRRR